jgi:hypothetical protein
MTLLTIIASANDELGLPALATVAGNPSPDANLMLRLANTGGKALMKRCAWAALITEKTFTTVAAAAQTASVASDFDRILPETMFNRTSRRRVWGPVDADTWQNIQSSLITYVDPAFRIRGSGTASILITPTPSAGDTVAYEYVSKNWCQSSGGTAQSAFAADADVSLFDEELHTLDLVWRWRAQKGLMHDSELAAFERYLMITMMNDGARARIQIGDVTSDRVPNPPQVPDTLIFT